MTTLFLAVRLRGGWARVTRLFTTSFEQSKELTAAENRTAITKIILDDSIASAEKIGRVVEIKAERDVQKADALVRSTNVAVETLQRLGNGNHSDLLDETLEALRPRIRER